jgi:2,5-diketo-D-gluconate reductase B
MPSDELPRLGLGTYSDDERHRWADIVESALELGYRHVDTAQVYENEEYVGEGLANADVPREDVFLSTKTVHVDVPGPDPDTEDVIEAAEGCLDRLGVDYVDMLYVHWPVGVYDHEVVLPAYDRLYDEGKIRHVGLSNFTPDLLDEAREVLDAPIFAHQVEMHPLLQQEDLLAYAREHDHWLVAYSPLAKGAVFDVPEVREVAEKHGASPAQVSIAWLLSKENVAAIPRTMDEDHLRSNFEARTLELDADDVAKIDAVEREKRCIDPDHGPWHR